jgi:hypothetical protein
MTSILKADTIQDTDGNNIINESGNTITIGASGDTTNIIGTLQNNGAAVGQTMAPAFFAYDESTQSLTDDTLTKLDLATEVFDTDGNFASDRFTPTTAGKYFLFAKTQGGSSSYENNRNTDIFIYKNGSALTYSKATFTPGGNTSGAGTTLTPFTSAIVDMNGSSDYVEVYVKVNTLSGNGSCENSVFGGYRVTGA